ncbi:MAG: T9SS type A sorting domain-containing protein [Bacteroidetes bacterium]|nr:T9SS type A sorting domain-containing protein [Bacteroidota bacterium]
MFEMKLLTLIVIALLLPTICSAQEISEATAQEQFREAVSRLEADSPFAPLASEVFTKTAAPPPFVCPYFLYYQNSPSASFYYYTENVPTTEFAAKIKAPPSPASACTVWTVMVDFELLDAALTEKDTIRIFVRNASPPYATIYDTWFLARSGENRGFIEIDPPVHPPSSYRAIISNPLRDVLIGYHIVGDSTHKVKWKFTTPSMYMSTPHSFAFPTRTTITTASQAVGASVDWVFQTRMCCNIPIPVELSVFDAQVDEDAVQLHWRTESETNNFSFEIQRALSPDGPWESRGFLAGHGTTSLPKEYRYRDRITESDVAGGQPPVYWYRLLQRDFDGTMYDYAPIQVYLADLSGSGFELSPMYPNPLRLSVAGAARIRYRVPEDANVRISVHDALGRELAMLANNMHSPGVYETSWYPGPNAVYSGYYFVRMQAGSYHATQKLTLVR